MCQGGCERSNPAESFSKVAEKSAREPIMKCQECDRQATFHITELSDGKPQELHLCEECARKYLTEPEEVSAETSASLAGMLAQQLAVGETAEELARLEQKACPDCGITFLEFRKNGRLGCPNDYTFFAEELEPLILNIHGETLHTGKIPQRCGGQSKRQTELIRLRRDMKEAVTKEDYERASRIRDQIQQFENEE
jgi:protein arginine kinase activator